MDLELLQNLEEGMSVEEHIRMAVQRMKPDVRLDMVMKVVGMGLEAEERLHDVVAVAWELVVKEEWWRARYGTFKEFEAQSGLADSVADVIRRRKQTKAKKRSFEAMAAKLWGVKDLATILGPELMPEHASKRFLEVMKVLARRLQDSEEAIERLSAARDERLRGRERGRTRKVKLQVRDVEAVLRELEDREEKQVRIEEEGMKVSVAESMTERAGERMAESMTESMLEATLESTLEGMAAESMAESTVESMEESTLERAEESTLESRATEGMEDVEEGEESSTEEGEGRVCGCNDVDMVQRTLKAMRSLRKKDVKGRVNVVGRIGREDWRQICHRHVRAIASCWELKTSGVTRVQLIERVMEVQGKVESLDELRRDERTYLWFRMEGRPGREDDGLGPFKYTGIREDEFTFDRVEV